MLIFLLSLFIGSCGTTGRWTPCSAHCQATVSRGQRSGLVPESVLPAVYAVPAISDRAEETEGVSDFETVLG